jgi:hypothetical protein
MIVNQAIRGRLEKELRFWQELVDKQIEGLEPEKRTRVSEACASCGLDDAGTRDVLATTCDLIEFERHGRENLLTDAQIFETIEYIRDTSFSLAMAMRDLPPFPDRIELGQSFRHVTRELGELPRMKLDGSPVPDALAFEVLARAADRMLSTRGDMEGRGGRRRLRAHYSEKCISALANTFDKYGFPVGRGGPFERLCSVVFEVAGVRATPEGVIRYYLSNRNKPASDAPENSGG